MSKKVMTPEPTISSGYWEVIVFKLNSISESILSLQELAKAWANSEATGLFSMSFEVKGAINAITKKFQNLFARLTDGRIEGSVDYRISHDNSYKVKSQYGKQLLGALRT